MSLSRWAALTMVAWTVVLTILHVTLNLGGFKPGSGGQEFRVGYLPVT